MVSHGPVNTIPGPVEPSKVTLTICVCGIAVDVFPFESLYVTLNDVVIPAVVVGFVGVIDTDVAPLTAEVLPFVSVVPIVKLLFDKAPEPETYVKGVPFSKTLSVNAAGVPYEPVGANGNLPWTCCELLNS